MGFENRNGNRYYYRKTRAGNRVKSAYVGKGELPDLFAELDRGRQIEKSRDALKRFQERCPEEALDNYLSELEEHIKTLVEAFLVGKEFYKTKSREWRFKLYE